MPPDPKLYCRWCKNKELVEQEKPAPKQRKFLCEKCGHSLHLVVATPAAAKAFHQNADRRLDSSSQPPEEPPSTS